MTVEKRIQCASATMQGRNIEVLEHLDRETKK